MSYLCGMIGHSRCRRDVRPLAGHWFSNCRRCGVRLVRIRRKVWQECAAWPRQPRLSAQLCLPLFDGEHA